MDRRAEYLERARAESDGLRAQIAQWISDYHDRNGYAPTIRELCRAFDRTLSVMHYHLKVMRTEGVVDWIDGDARTLHLVAGIDTDG